MREIGPGDERRRARTKAERTRAAYIYFLLTISLASAVATIAHIRSEPPIRPGAITTRWRETGDVVERCVSCHVDPHPSSQDALLKIHPIATYGCVACHGGSASAIDLRAHDGLVDHEAHAKFPLAEALCRHCHQTEKKFESPDGTELAPHLARGEAIFDDRCAACHDPNARRDRALPFGWISSATTPTSALHALESPRAPMPNFFRDASSKEDARDLVAWLWSRDSANGERIRGTANVPGASSEEGGEMFAAYGCAACHASGFGDISAQKSEDFIAYYIENPRRVRPSTKMPSFRLTRREAASIAKFIASSEAALPDDEDARAAATAAWQNERSKCAAASDLEITRAECGAKIAERLGCASCHAEAGAPAKRASDLMSWGATAPTAARLEAALDALHAPSHPGIDLTSDEQRDLLVALAGNKMNGAVTASFEPSRAPYFDEVRGDELMNDRGCFDCHVRSSRERRAMGGVDAPRARVPSLFGEGGRVQPEWLLEFLRDPEANGVRPSLHPEWVWGELVPPEKMAARMPTYFFTNDETTAIVRALAKRDHGDFPYANVTPPGLSTSDLLSAVVHINGAADNGGACMRCHYLGALPIDRAKTDLDSIAPDLGKISHRLRPWFVADLLAGPQDFVEGMPALWPDPNGAPLAWTIPQDATPKKNAADQIALVRDFLFLLRDETRLPRPGDELKTPILGLSASSAPPKK